MKKTKKWYQSKTIWGVFIAVIGFVMTNVFGVNGITLPENADFQQIQAYTEAIAAANGNVGVIMGQILAAAGTVLSIIGRVKAESKIV